MNVRSRFLSALLLGGALLVLAGGCGSSGTEKAKVYKASGKVLYKKKTPTVGALIVFHPVNPDMEKQIGGKPFAKVKEDGSFTLTTFEENDGAPEGDYNVTVDWQVKAKEAKFSLGEGGGGADKLGGRYGDPRNSLLKASVKSGQANEFNFEVD